MGKWREINVRDFIFEEKLQIVEQFVIAYI